MSGKEVLALADDLLPVTDAAVDYIVRFGSKCRDCADENGVCPSKGLPCADGEKAVRHVLSAINYGVKNGYLALRSSSAGSRPGREEIARIIDPSAWVMESGYWVEQTHSDEALAKADAILSLHPSGIEDVQTRFAESESTTHRESVTECGWRTDIENAPKDERILVANELWDDTFGEVQVALTYNGEWIFDSGMSINYLPDDEEFEAADFLPQYWKPLDTPSAPLSTDASACPTDGFVRSSLNQSNSFSTGAEAMREACIKCAKSMPNLVPTSPKHVRGLTGADVADALSALPLPSETQSGEPAQAWELSDETKARIQEIDDNRRNAAINASNIVAGSVPPSAGDVEPVAVEDLFFTDRSLPVMGMSVDVADKRILRLHFRRDVTTADRQNLIDAMNAAIVATHPQPAPEVREALERIAQGANTVHSIFPNTGPLTREQMAQIAYAALSTKGAQS